MSERTRFVEPEKPVHPMGYRCENCLHVVKDLRPGSRAMKCCAHPPTAQGIFGQHGEFAGTISISPPVNEGEFCGEFKDRSAPLNA